MWQIIVRLMIRIMVQTNPVLLFRFPSVEKLEEEIKSKFHELRDGKVWFSEETKREQREAQDVSYLRYVLHSRAFLAFHYVRHSYTHASFRSRCSIFSFPFTRPFVFPFMAFRKCGVKTTSRLTAINCDI